MLSYVLLCHMYYGVILCIMVSWCHRVWLKPQTRWSFETAWARRPKTVIYRLCLFITLSRDLFFFLFHNSCLVNVCLFQFFHWIIGGKTCKCEHSQMYRFVPCPVCVNRHSDDWTWQEGIDISAQISFRLRTTNIVAKFYREMPVVEINWSNLSYWIS